MKYKIKEIRKSKGLTQKQLGALLGVSASAVSQFEAESANIKTDTLEKIAAALDCAVIDLIDSKSYVEEVLFPIIGDWEQYQRTLLKESGFNFDYAVSKDSGNAFIHVFNQEQEYFVNPEKFAHLFTSTRDYFEINLKLLLKEASFNNGRETEER